MIPCRIPVLVLAIAVLGGRAAGQEVAGPRASQHGVISQEINLTSITLEYDRPVARGRELFGGIVDWDVVWTPGANRATWLESTTPFTIEGQHLDAGRYGIWMIPHQDAPWEVILVSEWDTHHSYFPFEAEVARIRIDAESGFHMETLAFYFPVVGPYEAELRFHWGPTTVPMRIEVPR